MAVEVFNRTGDGFNLSVDTSELSERFQNLPDILDKEVEMVMRRIVGALADQVRRNIVTMFGTSHLNERPPHVRLRDTVSTAVYRDGTSIVGSVFMDTEAVPYARILELGGVIRPHRILPRTAEALYFPIATLKNFGDLEFEGRSFGDMILAFAVNHPGAQMVGYHYMISALTDLAKATENDLNAAVAAAISRARLS